MVFGSFIIETYAGDDVHSELKSFHFANVPEPLRRSAARGSAYIVDDYGLNSVEKTPPSRG